MFKQTFALFFLIFTVKCEQCFQPQVTQSTYTTQDATVLKHVAYIINFQVTCKRGESGNLYALLQDVLTPIASVGTGKYQLSWTEDIKNAKAGEFSINVYDESGYSVLRKAMRAGEDVKTAPVFTQLEVNHPGIYSGPWISCEFLAVGFSVVVAYVAIHFRSKLLN